MSKKHYLSYPAPRPQKRTFNPLKDIGKSPEKNYFDRVFRGDFMQGWFKKISLHGLLPVVLGAILTLTGTRAMALKSIAVLVCALWLSLSISIEISERKCSQFKKIWLFCASACLSFCAAMLIMKSFLVEVLEDQRSGVYAKLAIQPIMNTKGGMFKTFASVTNGGGTDIQIQEVRCSMHRLVTAPYGGFTDLTFSNSSAKDTLKANGDGETSGCMDVLYFKFGTYFSCVNLRVEVLYKLTTQPDEPKTKTLRFVAYGENLSIYRQQPVESAVEYCPQPQNTLRPHPAP